MELRMTTDLEQELPARIGFNFEELKAELEERLHHYNGLVVTEETVKEGKEDRAKLRKLREAIETRRKEVKRQCEQPYKAFEAQVKQLTALIDAPVAAIDSQIKRFEDQQREEKRAEIAAAYDELVPESIREIIPFERILDSKWLNKATTMKSVRADIEMRVKRTNVDMALIDGVDPKYLIAVRNAYIATLDIDFAMTERDKLVATEQAFQQREAEMAAYKRLVAETPPAAVQEPRREPIPQPCASERLHNLILEFKITQPQATALKQFLEDNHIKYRKID